MEKNNAKSKLSKNTTRLVAINALQKIRTLVDGYEAQDKRNKRNAIIFSVALLVFFATAMYLLVFY